MFEKSGIVSSINKVRESLSDSVEAKYGISETSQIIDKILSVHGLSKKYFDFVKNMESLIEDNIADASIDTNSNKNEITVSGLLTEVTSPVNKIVGYRYLYRIMKELYGQTESSRLMGEMYDYSLILADSGKILLPYCFSIDASKIIKEGRPFGVVHSTPPKRLSSYIAALNETVHQISNHLAGALAIGSLFLDSAYILLYREGKSLSEIKNDVSVRKYIENCFQSFVHSVNHLSRNAVESPFTNISFFDRVKIKSFLDPEAMGWYYSEPFDTEGVEKDQYLTDYILELQRIFINFFNKGVELQGGKPFRFPVATFNISKTEKDGKIILQDEKFIDEDVVTTDIYRYNILTSEGSKVSSCCRLINDNELFELGGQSNSFGGSGLSLGSHRVVTINFNRIGIEATSVDNYFSILEQRIKSSAKILVAHRELIKRMMDKGLHPFMLNGYLRLDRMFSTFGIIGISEVQETLSRKFDISSRDIVEESLKLLNKLSKEITGGIISGNDVLYSSDEVIIDGVSMTVKDAKKKRLTSKISESVIERLGVFNIEQIPAESVAGKAALIDKLIFGNDIVPQEMYANQFIPLWEESSVWDRMDKDGKYNRLLTGGGIVHINIEDKVTQKQARKLIDYASKSGCEHFALNSVYSECENSHTSFGNLEICPICSGKIIEKYTRVVGFMTPISSWNKVRREWEFPRRKFYNKDDKSKDSIYQDLN